MITLSHNTRIAVQIAVDDDSGSVAALIMALTALVTLLVKLGSLITWAALLVGDFVEAAQFTNALFAIGFKSLAYGLGVRL
jgi:hypothetical protein